MNNLDFPYRSYYYSTHELSIEVDIKAVTVSSKFQVVIPLEVREAMGIQPGTRVQVL